ncbi:phosphate ABC transporter substrate-binding protein, PhoT family [Marininema mesophilum]|uniref:Phosphate-binding protein n=1 Tax=Marininema mesophilum TaxID=1048340 RepID=A0A1H2XT16_9BACL|nr:PstS family phosphate ABC transporter substrate-binding protein [Marininema mesophilum]SDW96092.1 phosphate ABC transporter substrate-binding protein, PhoT family [Marininema mesophilum]
MWKKGLAVAGAFILSVSLVACSSNAGGGSEKGKGLTGTIKIDGSSTVYPISQAVAEEFMKKNPGVNVTVAESGTGAGFQKWSKKETDLSDASRLIKDDEKAAAKKSGLEPKEIPVAFDGISVVVNKKNNFAKSITKDELKKIWEPNSKVKTWKDVRSSWPNKPIKLYGPGTSDGTFDYFTGAIVGEEGKSRTDYTQSEDDNTLVKGVAGDEYALGYFGFSYYKENKSKLNALKVDNGDGAVAPSVKTIKDGSYAPLSRMIYVYADKKTMAENKAIKEFLSFYLKDGKQLVSDVGFIPLQDKDYKKGLARLEGK